MEWNALESSLAFRLFFMSEIEVRKLRDKVFEVPIQDKGWEGCKKNWMRLDSIQWLEEQVSQEISISVKQEIK